MKKLILVLVTISFFTACKSDKKTEVQTGTIDVDSPEKTSKQSDGLILLKGDFIYYADAAVLQTHREVYGVVLDKKAMDLNKQAEPFKKEQTDMVTVTIRGKVTPKPEGEEGWPFRVAIKEIIKVEKIDSDKNDIIKLGSK